jgi:hypothetical protein
MITEPGQEITWGETHVGTRSIFEAAGFTAYGLETFTAQGNIAFTNHAPGLKLLPEAVAQVKQQHALC